MRTGQTLPAGDLRRPVALLMLQKLLENHLRPRFRVSHRRHGFVFQRQLLPAAGEISVNGRSRLTQPLDEMGAVMDQQRSRLRHAQ